MRTTTDITEAEKVIAEILLSINNVLLEEKDEQLIATGKKYKEIIIEIATSQGIDVDRLLYQDGPDCDWQK